jgi:hypothetical protein
MSATWAPLPTRILRTRWCGEFGSATRNQKKGRGGEDGRPLDGAARRAALVAGLAGCLDPVVTGPYVGSRATREEKTTTRRNRGPARPPAQARWKKTGVIG